MNFDRQKKIAESRAKALQRIRDRQKKMKNPSPVAAKAMTATTADVNSKVTKATSATTSNVRSALSPLQKATIERNRQKALERKRVREGVADGNLRNASSSTTTDVLDNVRYSRLHHNEQDTGHEKRYTRPSIRKSDYIEYDFSTMKDTFGGFLSEDTNDDMAYDQKEKSLDDWKKQQEERDALNPLGPAPPPLDIVNAPTCFECGSIDIDKKMNEVFGCRVCRRCEEKFPEKYSLLTKTECKEDYFLTEPELADVDLFKRIVKENPHSGTFSKMQLFLRYQIEEYAFKKWGGEEKLDNEWLRREAMRKARREKKFNTKLQQMRRKLRAEEITRKIRGNKVRHEHDWSAPVKADGDNPSLYKRRCMECGMEVEEMIM
ncbi:DEKNAAC100600 [Brettanomyces naardenensis]|uniref:DEKNAAC100600 n=1 Tax=Brettanomyces naardenensis TaxID=13370 RepID=A0A448YFL3_BRENA|nr:DEKNAAC100600 [Brettanomyces naardenensis]